MNQYQYCPIVAEACCNHMGDISIAEDMIKTAKLCGADYIKFQKRNPEISVPKNQQHKSHPRPEQSFGDTYLNHRKYLEFNIDQQKHLQDVCKKTGIEYSCSVWDIKSAQEILSLSPNYVKIPSAMNNNYKLLDYVYQNSHCDVHVSLGMINSEEIEQLSDYLSAYIDRTVVYWTTSGYPVKFEELFLLEIQKLVERFPRVGFSGHHLGIAADVAAYVLGATWIERHFTLDRTWKGTDQAASLEPSGLEKLCRDIKAIQKSLQYKVGITNDEKKNRQKLRISS